MAAQVITFQCTLKNRCGQLISKTTNFDVLNDGRQNDSLLPALAEALEDLSAGERRIVHLRADQAYGFYEPKLVITRSRDELANGDTLKRGEQVRYEVNGELKLCRVVAADEDSVTFDANHPLAGQDLVFEIVAMQTRKASRDELREDEIGRELLH